ncbi:NAD(P)/FAD-dependent oxidoreductase [Desulfurococcus mucosus]|uniref:FAD-dependent pyridine nucleotide-disulfide oxidoreductase n=1 Tax=Desulfurococcus mucosus (strain ATCC 35584 / DSM 2162 / JCM 9187 / O7/1) TaxID=765177 RepID=E8R8W6_DESM0|nr:FAD-dependent oxidoreductase [Desulfurococcus mucosus]ADV64942.1 FAD-dependent pyridine nucleotide-disulfide oxidoreductase [Desulfurococcus mucosus DSM 2162]
MVRRYDILVIGGGAAGFTAAITAKILYRDSKVLMVTKTDKSPIVCALPYAIAGNRPLDDYLMPYSYASSLGVEILVDEVVDIDTEERVARTRGGEEIRFDNLVIATGSRPEAYMAEGVDLKGVYVLGKEYREVAELREAVNRDGVRVVLVGSGLTTAELADALSGIPGLTDHVKRYVTIVSRRKYILSRYFDEEFAELAERELEAKGVTIYSNTRVKRIHGHGRVEEVELDNGEVVKADVVVIVPTWVPNTELASRAGLEIRGRGIVVNDYMRTSKPYIYAAGDCVEKRDFLTSDQRDIKLATLACEEARRAISAIKGVTLSAGRMGRIPVTVTRVGGVVMGAAGYIESHALNEGISYIVGKARAVNRHPAWLPGGCEIQVKLLFLEDGRLIGGQAAGRCNEVAEIVNSIALAIQGSLRVEDLIIGLQHGSHPLLTYSPVMHPLINAAVEAYLKMKN